jgi:Zn-dependent protease with chaperone function
MDKAGRNFLALAAVALVVGAYGLCALVAYGILPLVEGKSQGGFFGLLAVAGLAGLLTASGLLAARSLRRSAKQGRTLSRRIDAERRPSPPALLLVAQEAGLAGRVTLIDCEAPLSFVHGALAPKVVVSSGLLSRLSVEELRAALAHERYHVLSLDPLRSTFAQAAVAALFFLPAARIVHRRYEAARELAADQRAAALVGRRPLAAAMLKALDGVSDHHPTAIGLAAPAVMDLRLTQLESEISPRLGRIDPPSLAVTAIGVFAFLALLAWVPLAMGGVADLSRELEPAGLIEGVAYCLAPVILAAALGYRRLALDTHRG